MERLLRALSIVNLVLCVWMVLSGIFLFFFYRPTAAAAWEDISTLDSDFTFGLVIQTSHRLATPVLLVTLTAWAFMLAVASDFGRSSVLAGAVFVTVGAAVTGLILPWDQLALWSVTAGTNMRGYWPIIADDEIRFVMTNGAVTSTDTIVRILILHVVLGLVLTCVVAWVRRRSMKAPIDQPLSGDHQVMA